jgi:hypothetical protein
MHLKEFHHLVINLVFQPHYLSIEYLSNMLQGYFEGKARRKLCNPRQSSIVPMVLLLAQAEKHEITEKTIFK